MKPEGQAPDTGGLSAQPSISQTFKHIQPEGEILSLMRHEYCYYFLRAKKLAFFFFRDIDLVIDR